jgi:hypothetical protein
MSLQTGSICLQSTLGCRIACAVSTVRARHTVACILIKTCFESVCLCTYSLLRLLSRTLKVGHDRAACSTAGCEIIRNNCLASYVNLIGESYDVSIVSDELKSPMHPNNYCSNLDCLTLIPPATSGNYRRWWLCAHTCACAHRHRYSTRDRSVFDRTHARLVAHSNVSTGRVWQ